MADELAGRGKTIVVRAKARRGSEEMGCGGGKGEEHALQGAGFR